MVKLIKQRYKLSYLMDRNQHANACLKEAAENDKQDDIDFYMALKADIRLEMEKING